LPWGSIFYALVAGDVGGDDGDEVARLGQEDGVREPDDARAVEEGDWRSVTCVVAAGGYIQYPITSM
jgi:hypothetical protein